MSCLTEQKFAVQTKSTKWHLTCYKIKSYNIACKVRIFKIYLRVENPLKKKKNLKYTDIFYTVQVN